MEKCTLKVIKCTFQAYSTLLTTKSASTTHYRTLRGQDQREKCALNAIKHTFQANSALLTTKSALTVH